MATKIVDLSVERAARQARPFQGRLLRPVAARMDQHALAAVRKAVADGVAQGRTTDDIVRQVLRDQVNAKARAAL
jgi:hypothetical protein